MNRIGSLLAAALLPFLLTSCQSKDLEYLSFENLKITKAGYPESTIQLDVVCFNPNPFRIRLEELNSEVYFNENYVGKAVSIAPTPVPAKDTFLVPVQMKVKLGSTLNGLFKMIGPSKEKPPFAIRFEGEAKLRKGALSLRYPISYKKER
jgi:LEA14-like dessication related protein